MRPEFWFPAKPFTVTQAFGIYNPAYQQFGFSRHNGVDFLIGQDKLLHSPVEGFIIRTGNVPSGNGIFLTILSKDFFTFPDGVTCQVAIDLLHCEKLLVADGQAVGIGDPLAVPDNTGFSTGPHTHIQLRRVEYHDDGSFRELDTNDAHNSFDPSPYWSGFYAQDKTLVISLYKKTIELLTKWRDSLKRSKPS